MELIFLLGMVGMVVIYSLLKKGTKQVPIAPRSDSNALWNAPPPVPAYFAHPLLFTKAERSFLGVLDHMIGSEFRIFGKVRAADVLGVSKGKSRREWQTAFNMIKSKHFDFVICNASDCSIRLLIELDDKSHASADRAKRDAFVDRATSAAGITLLHFPCRQAYSTSEISEKLAPYLMGSTGLHTPKVTPPPLPGT